MTIIIIVVAIAGYYNWRKKGRERWTAAVEVTDEDELDENDVEEYVEFEMAD